MGTSELLCRPIIYSAEFDAHEVGTVLAVLRASTRYQVRMPGMFYAQRHPRHQTPAGAVACPRR